MSKPWYAAFTEDGYRWTAGPESLNDALDRAAFFETLGKGRVSFGQTKPGGARQLPFVQPIENVRKLLAQGGHKPPSQGGYQNIKSYRKRNPSRERGAEIAHALFGGPKRKVTKRFLKNESVGWNGFAVKVVKYGKDQTVIRGTGVSERAVPTSSIEDIPNWEWQNRWDKQWEGKKANPKRNPAAPKAGSTIQIPWAYDFANGYVELRVKRARGRTVEGTVTKATGEAAHENAVGDVISTEFAGYRAVKANPKRNPWTYPTDPGAMFTHYLKLAEERNQDWDGSSFTRENQEAYLSNAAEALAGMREFGRKVSPADVARLRKAQQDWNKFKAVYDKYIAIPHNKRPGAFRWYLEDRAARRKKNPSSHIGDIIRVRHTPSADAPAVYAPFENNYRVLDVSNDPSRARRPIKVASTTNKHGQKGAVSWISVDQIVKVVRRAK